MRGLVVLASEVSDHRPQFVYFIRSASPVGEIKIGHARNPRARLRELQVGNPYRLTLEATEPGDRTLEQSLHHRFQPHRLMGEWFAPAPDIQGYIRDLVESQRPVPKRRLPDTLITVKGAAEATGMTEPKIRGLLKKGRMATWRLPSGRIRIDLAELTALVEGRVLIDPVELDRKISRVPAVTEVGA